MTRHDLKEVCTSGKLGLAMYTVHRSAEADLCKTMEKLRAQGYEELEFFGPMSNWTPAEIRHALSQSGLAMTGWHTEWRDLQPEVFDRTAEYLSACGMETAVIPCLGGAWNIGHTGEEECKEVWLRHFEDMEKMMEKLKKAGLRTGYHNHAHEFELSYDGKSLFEFIFDSMPEDLVIEFDSGNCIEGGGDPMKVLEKYRGRDIILHLKPWSRTRAFDIVLGDEDDENNWEALLSPENARYMHLLVESENSMPDEFGNSGACLDAIKRYLI